MPIPQTTTKVQTETEQILIQILHVEDRSDSLQGKIALTVARDIIEGRMPPGHDLNSIDLARRFDSSRTPVREGLMLLEKGGLVEIPARRRPRVMTLTPAQVKDIYSLRARLCALVAERICASPTPEALDRLDRALFKMREAVTNEDVDHYFWMNVSFHEESAALANSEALKRSLDGLGSQVLRLRHVSMSARGRMRLSFQDHERLVRAYHERDSIVAAALSQSIIMGAYKALEDQSAHSNNL